MRTTLCSVALALLAAGGAAAQQDTTRTRAQRDSAAAADSLAIVRELEGMQAGRDFFAAFSPEREDPGRKSHSTRTTPKLVGGIDPASTELAAMVYEKAIERVVRVSTAEVAESAKLLENIFRAINIAMINEMKVVLTAMGIDIWEVIDAAKTKPFGFMPFYPGPGLGGHCIPIDPFYLTWKAREFDITTRFIELAGEVNTHMPYHVVDRLAETVDRSGRAFSGSRILILGVAYKKNVDDMRESPSLKLIELIEARGARVDYHDPHIPALPPTRRHGTLAGRRSVDLTSSALAAYDADGADLVILCVPVGAMEEAARAVAPGLSPGAVVSDVGSSVVTTRVMPAGPERFIGLAWCGGRNPRGGFRHFAAPGVYCTLMVPRINAE